MKKCEGTSRIAYVGEKLTVKLANPDIGRAISNLRKASRDGIRGLWECIKSREGNVDGLRFPLLRGLMENIRERAISKTGSEIVVPTRASLLGLVNIQDTAAAVVSEEGEIHEAFWKKLVNLPEIKGADEGVIRAGGHTLPQPNNYGLHEGEVKLIDYGEKRLDELLEQYGYLLKEVLEEFKTGK